MTDQNKIAQMLEVLADNGFGMYDLALLMRSLDEEVIKKATDQLTDDEQLEERIIRLLDTIPIEEQNGREFLVTGIKLAYKCKRETGKNISFLEKKVAGVYDISCQVVKRMMENILELSWRDVSEEVAKKYRLYRTYKIKQYPTKEMCKPTNGMFVTAIANYLIEQDCQKTE